MKKKRIEKLKKLFNLTLTSSFIDKNHKPKRPHFLEFFFTKNSPSFHFVVTRLTFRYFGVPLRFSLRKSASLNMTVINIIQKVTVTARNCPWQSIIHTFIQWMIKHWIASLAMTMNKKYIFIFVILWDLSRRILFINTFIDSSPKGSEWD